MSDEMSFSVAAARDFATHLEHFGDDLSQETARLKAGLARLGETFRGREYDRFAEELSTATSALRRFTDEADEYARELRRKASVIETFSRG